MGFCNVFIQLSPFLFLFTVAFLFHLNRSDYSQERRQQRTKVPKARERGRRKEKKKSKENRCLLPSILFLTPVMSVENASATLTNQLEPLSALATTAKRKGHRTLPLAAPFVAHR